MEPLFFIHSGTLQTLSIESFVLFFSSRKCPAIYKGIIHSMSVFSYVIPVAKYSGLSFHVLTSLIFCAFLLLLHALSFSCLCLLESQSSLQVHNIQCSERHSHWTSLLWHLNILTLLLLLLHSGPLLLKGCDITSNLSFVFWMILFFPLGKLAYLGFRLSCCWFSSDTWWPGGVFLLKVENSLTDVGALLGFSSTF